MSSVETTSALESLRYPIGRFAFDHDHSQEIEASLAAIEAFPSDLRATVEDLNDDQLATAYREGGWTVRQLVHHIADSHINIYVRCRLALTEQNPTIRPYDENLWAALDDARTAPVDLSLHLLGPLHARWALLLRSIQPQDWQRSFHHPVLGNVGLDKAAALYAWHGRHHLAHITALRERMGW